MKFLMDHLGIRDYLRIFLRKKWYFLLVFMIMFGAGVFKIFTRTFTYESSCVIQINPIRRSTSLKRVMPDVTDDNMYRSLAPKMLYSQYLTQVIDSLNLRQNEKFREIALERKRSLPDHTLNEIIDLLVIKRLKKMIKVRILGRNTIQVKAEASSPDFAYQLVSTLIKIYIKTYIQNEVSLVKSTMEFNYEQIAEFKKKLEKSEQKLHRFRYKNIMDEDGDVVLNIEASDRINEAIVAIDLSMKGKREYLNYLNNELNIKTATIDYPNTPTIQSIFQEIDIKIDQMAVLLKKYVWNSSELIKVNRKINLLRESIKGEIEKNSMDKFSNVNAQTYSLLTDRAKLLVDLEIANRKRKVLRRTLDFSRFNVSETQNRDVELVRLEQEVANNQSIYNLFLQQSKGIQIEEAIQHASVSNRFQFLELPIKPIEPNNTSLIVLLFGTLVIAVGAGLGVVYWLEFFDRTIRTVEEAESYFNIHVIGVIPNMENEPFVNPELIDHHNNKKGETWLNQLAIKNIIRTEGVPLKNITKTPLV